MSPRLSSLPILACLAAAALFGASAPAAKTLLEHTGPFALAGLLYLGAAAGVLPLAGFAPRGAAPRWRGNGRSVRRLAGAVVAGGLIAPVLLLAGLRQASAASVALWLGLEAPATAVLAGLFFAEHLRARVWIAVGVVGVAAALMAWPGAGQPSVVAPALLVAAACLFWGLDNNLTALIDGFTPAQCTLVKGSVAGAVNLAIGLSLEPAPDASRTVWLALLVGAVSYGLSLVLYIAAAQQLGAARSQLIFATAPFWGAVASWSVLGEPVTMGQAAAGPLMLAALWLLNTERHGHAHSHGAVTHVHWHRHDDGHHDGHHDGPRDRRAAGARRARGWPWAWIGHSHEHSHDAVAHAHEHRPDLHHRHPH